MRILIHSNAPWAPSGYGKQTAQLALRLRALGHEVAVSAFHGLHGAPLTWNGIMVYPGSGEDLWAQDLLPAHYGHFGADLLITLMDVWVLDGPRLKGMNVAHWIPVDCTPLGVMDRRTLTEGGGRPVAMSLFGKAQLEEAGFPALYAPHAIDTSVFAPLPDRDAVREQLGVADKFLVGIAAANQDPMRKGFSESLEAFAQFARRHADARLLIHSRAEARQGVRLSALIRELGLEGKVSFGDQYLITAGLIGDGEVARWYGVLDVLSNCAFGEGFGLPVLESQACGTPVIVTDASAMSELCGTGWKVKVDHLRDAYWNRGHDAWWVRPSPPEILKAYERAYAAWKAGKMPALRERARKFSLRYDADKVVHEHWEGVLAELAPRDAAADAVPLESGGGPAISVCFASRGRPESLREAIFSLLDKAAEPDDIEIIIAADPDDPGTLRSPLPPQARLWVAPERYGYNRLHDYLNPLARMAAGTWCAWWNDDMRMLTAAWDQVITGHRPAILWPQANHVAHANIAPVWPRAWSDALGRVTPTSHMDTYLQWLGETLGRHDRIPVDIVHDRADVTGGHDDQTYAEGRRLLGSEGMVPGFDTAAIRALIEADATVIRGLL